MIYGVKHTETVPTCPACGCRLKAGIGHSGVYYTHFYGYGADARGCKCSMLSVIWQKIEDRWMGMSTNTNSPWSYNTVELAWQS